MRAIKLNAQVTRDHALHLELPEDIAEGPAEVIVLVEDKGRNHSQDQPGTLADFLAGPRVESRLIRSKTELDRELQAERDSWE